MMRLLRPARSGIFLRSFRLHSLDYARETIVKICRAAQARWGPPSRRRS
jgi:hypothetical protein